MSTLRSAPILDISHLCIERGRGCMIPAAEPALETVISGKYAQLDFWRSVTRADRRQARFIPRRGRVF